MCENKGFLSTVVGDLNEQTFFFLLRAVCLSPPLFYFAQNKQEELWLLRPVRACERHSIMSRDVSGFCPTWRWSLKTLTTQWDEIFVWLNVTISTEMLIFCQFTELISESISFLPNCCVLPNVVF